MADDKVLPTAEEFDIGRIPAIRRS